MWKNVQGDTAFGHFCDYYLGNILCVRSFLCFQQILAIFIIVVITTCLAQELSYRFRNKSNRIVLSAELNSILFKK